VKQASDVIAFWFVENGPEDWFGGKEDFDARLAKEFTETHRRAAAGEVFTWRDTADGRLAEIIVLDQFSRQLCRGSARAFSQDGMALVLAQEAVRLGADRDIPLDRRMFVYMPYMHSESLVVHEAALPLFESLENADTLEFERAHADILRRFGRFPLRNAALGRESTPEEIAYMQEREGKMF
jgi:uncharacterized protein (DUF924 family)